MTEDLELARLLVAAVEASKSGYVLIRIGHMPLGQPEVRVNVRHGTDEHTSRSHAPLMRPAIVEALGRALDWLRHRPVLDR